MFIEMLKTSIGCNDGKNSDTYEAGKTYDLSDSLAKCFIDMQVGKKVEDEKKAEDKAPVNKAHTSDQHDNKALKPKANKGDSK
jgi:hypothetical protein